MLNIPTNKNTDNSFWGFDFLSGFWNYDANNIYNLFFSSDKDFFEIIAEYNDNVYNGKINRIDEFLKLFGNGDTKRGFEYIEKQLRNVDIGAHYLGNNNRRLSFIAETIADLFSVGNPYADDVINEDDGRVEKDIKKFLNYLRNGMSNKENSTI